MKDVPLHGFDYTVQSREARDLRSLAGAGVPLATGRLVRIAPDSSAPLVDEGEILRPLTDVSLPSEPSFEDLTWASQRDRVWVRVIAVEGALRGGATSAHPISGDPEELLIWHEGGEAKPWKIERRSARVSHEGEGLSVAIAESVADLVDRAQLALGAPVEIEWCVQPGSERPKIASVRPLALQPEFLPGSWSRLALVEADEGTVAPLAIDALDRGLSVHATHPAVESTVRRVYARPYRRRQHNRARLGRTEPASLSTATADVARVAKQGAAVLRDALPFERGLDFRRTSLEKPQLAALSDAALLDTVRERHRLVAESFLLLDRCRELTRHALEALEAVIGKLPDDSYLALAAPRAVGERRRAHERLLKLRQKLDAAGDWNGKHIPSALRKRFEETKRDLAELRPLGIDVIPLPIGHSDEELLRSLRSVTEHGHATRERARDQATKQLLLVARSRSLGLARAALARTVTVLLGRIARVKGGVGEGVAASLLQLRRAACEVGTRLMDRGILEAPEDALYLSLHELEEALEGEPGAYAARVRFRREDDARWAKYDAPRRVG